jgi:hypothetical protein
MLIEFELPKVVLWKKLNTKIDKVYGVNRVFWIKKDPIPLLEITQGAGTERSEELLDTAKSSFHTSKL